jgi:hypothetical protein
LVFLSGGTDSSFIAFAAQAVGKTVESITFRMSNCDTPDSIQAEKTAQIMGWKHHLVDVPTDDMNSAYLQMVRGYKCGRKTEIECLYPMIFVIEKARQLGFKQALTGLDQYVYADSRNWRILAANSESDFEDAKQASLDAGGTHAGRLITETARKSGIELSRPLFERELLGIFAGVLPKDSDKPYPKHHFKNVYYSQFEKCGMLKTAGANLQKVANIESYFAPLLDDAEINIGNFQTGDITSRLSHLARS